MNDFIYSNINSIVRPKDKKQFKIGDKVYWNDPDYIYEDKEYMEKYGSLFVGNISDIMVIQEQKDKFSIEVFLENVKPFSLGRLSLNDIEHNPEDIEEYWLPNQYLEIMEGA